MTRLRSLAGLFVMLTTLAGASGSAWPQSAGPADPDLSVHALLADPQTPTGGNPAGDVTIVEFFDYNCPFCRKAQPDLEKLVATDHGVRLVYKDWPIFGAGSIAAARIALAAQWQGKYEAVHDALLEAPMRKEGADQVRALAVKAGADGALLDQALEAHGPEISAILARTEKQAEKLGAPGTPVFLIGPLLIERALDLEGFKKAVADARARARKAPNP